MSDEHKLHNSSKGSIYIEVKHHSSRLYLEKSFQGFGQYNVDPASQTVAQHYISTGLIYRVIWCFWLRDGKGHQHNEAVSNTVQSPNTVSMTGRRLWVNIETAFGECHVFAQNIEQTR